MERLCVQDCLDEFRRHHRLRCNLIKTQTLLMQSQNRLGHGFTEFDYMTVGVIDAEAALSPRMLLNGVNDVNLLFYVLKEGVDAAAFKVEFGVVGSDRDLFSFIFKNNVKCIVGLPYG